MTRSARIGGIAIILVALLYLVSFAFSSPIVGFPDGDNPAVSLEFLRQHSDFYFVSGMASILAAITLTVAVLSVAETMLQPSSSLLMRTSSTLGLFAAAFLFAHGVLRVQSQGTLLYIEGLNHEWGLSAYLAVQMAGTQGLGSAGIFALSTWEIGLSLEGWRSRKLPRALSLLGILPALPWLIGLLGRLDPLGSLPDTLWLLYIGPIILGIPLWCVVLGVVLLRWKPIT
jgi:hypothetical protein